jgi:murein DD-endopeptidase MepM/ murein hydrolase activator NlpD
LKRTFPQKVKPIPSCETDNGMNIEHSKVLSESNRRTRTSAAVIGLAMSMGTQGLLLPQAVEASTVTVDSAVDSTATESAGSALPPLFDVAAASVSPESPRSETTLNDANTTVVDHRVQEGQTLSRIAQLYQVDSADILAANGLKADAVLRVGQVLQIPVDARIARLVDAKDQSADAPIYYGLVPGTSPIEMRTSHPSLSRNLLSGNRDQAIPNPSLKLKQDEALTRLQQKRDSLRLGLKQLPTSEATVETTTPGIQAIAPATLAQPVQSTVLPAAEKSGEKSVKSNVIAVLTPDIGSSSSPTYAALTHRVEIGQTLNSIARAYGVSAQQLVEVNRISDPNSIFVDQVLRIPQAFTSTTPSTPPVLGASRFGVGRAPQADVAPSESDSLGARFQPGSSVPAASPDSSATPSQFSGNAPSPELPAVRSRHDYVAGLRLEILQLRDRYKSTSSTSTKPELETPRSSENPVTVSASDSRVSESRLASARNPEFTPNPQVESLRTQIRKLNVQGSIPMNPQSVQAPQAFGARTPSVPAEKTTTVVAMAPVGSQSYDPVIGKTIGRLVSPDLPPLGSGDVYLPSGSGKFNGYIWPAKGMLTSPYGPRWGRMHRGIDVAAATGTPIVAAATGVVITAGWNSGGYGNLVEIKHPDGSVTLYGHNDRILVREGQQVAQGQQIAEMGSTGYSTGPHCHFEIHLPGHGAVNPMAHLPRERA